MKLVIVFVMLVLGMVHGGEDDGNIEPQELEMYCLEPPPTVDGPCRERKIWTYDTEKGQCVQIEGCFENAGPEYNMFVSKKVCQTWCPV